MGRSVDCDRKELCRILWSRHTQTNFVTPLEKDTPYTNTGSNWLSSLHSKAFVREGAAPPPPLQTPGRKKQKTKTGRTRAVYFHHLDSRNICKKFTNVLLPTGYTITCSCWGSWEFARFSPVSARFAHFYVWCRSSKVQTWADATRNAQPCEE